MVYDSDYREVSITTLETATPITAQGADTPGAFIVPTNVSRITEIRIYAIGTIADDAVMGFSSAIHIYGGGVVLGEGWFPGPTGVMDSVAVYSSTTPDNEPQIYHTNIPVKPGGQFQVDGYMLGEDIGALHLVVDIVYDGPVVGKIRDMDYRSIDLTAANTLVTLTERGAASVEGDIKPVYSTIGEIFIGYGDKIAASSAAAGFAVHLSGPGLLVAGNYKFAGRGITLHGDVGNAGDIRPLTRYICEIKTKINNPIRIQAQMLEADMGTAYSIVGFAYY